MLSAQVYDIIEATGAALHNAALASEDDARLAPPLVRYGPETQEQGMLLKRFLREQLYRHSQVVDTTERAKKVIRDLFDTYLHDPSQMPAGFARRSDTVRAVTDYIAGMTDRFALKEHHRLTGSELF
jgi:dGTPase